MAQTVGEAVLEFISQIGIFDVLVPFLLGTAVLYGMLEKTQIFGKDAHTVNTILSIGAGLLLTLTWSTRTIIMNIAPLLVVGIFFVFIMFLVVQWLGLDFKFLIDLVKKPYFFLPIILIGFLGLVIIETGLFNPILEQLNLTTNETSTEQITTEDLTNPITVLIQPQILGSLLILGVLAAISWMMTQRK